MKDRGDHFIVHNCLVMSKIGFPSRNIDRGWSCEEIKFVVFGYKVYLLLGRNMRFVIVKILEFDSYSNLKQLQG